MGALEEAARNMETMGRSREITTGKGRSGPRLPDGANHFGR